MRYLVLFACLWALQGCEQEPMQFFPQDQYYETAQSDQDGYKYDAVVIVSPPKTNLGLLKAINAYIKKTYTMDEIAQYKTVNVGFLQESSKTKRVYQPLPDFLEFEAGHRPRVPRFNHDDVLVGINIYRDNIYTDYSYDFANKYAHQCPSYIGVRSDDTVDYSGLGNCSPEEKKALKTYMNKHREDFSLRHHATKSQTPTKQINGASKKQAK